jgi:hypothetical protein
MQPPIRDKRLMSALATVLALALLSVGSASASAEDANSKDVTMTLEIQCGAEGGQELSFQPTLDAPLGLLVPNFEQSANISLNIVDETDCSGVATSIGKVSFTDTGFVGTDVTVGYSCDSSPLFKINGEFNCGDGNVSPTSIPVSVYFNENTLAGTFTNVLSFTLIPVQ